MIASKAMKTGQIKNLMIRADEALHRRLRVKMAEEDISLQALMLRLIEEWLEGERGATVATSRVTKSQDIPPKYRQQAQDFFDLLDSTDDKRDTVLLILKQWKRQQDEEKASRNNAEKATPKGGHNPRKSLAG